MESQVHSVVLLRSHVTIASPCFSTKATAVILDGMPATAYLRAAGAVALLRTRIHFEDVVFKRAPYLRVKGSDPDPVRML